MEALKYELEKIADDNGLEVCIVGDQKSGSPDYWYDDRLLKIRVKGKKSQVLLEIELAYSGYRLYKHREYNLTKVFKGRSLTKKWIVGFIKHNRVEDGESLELTPIRGPGCSEPIPEPLTSEEFENRKAERKTLFCKCCGQNEGCTRCFGKGTYVVDGFGKEV